MATHDLVSRIHDAAIRPEVWQRVLELLCKRVKGTLAIASTVGPDGERFEATLGLEESFREAYLGHWSEIPGMADSFLAARTGEVWITAQMVPPEVLERSAFYNEWSRPQRVKFAISGIEWRSARNEASYVMVLRPPSFGEYTGKEVDCFRELMPHFVRAAEIRRRLGARELERATLAAAIARLAVGVVLLDARGHVVYANPAAEDLSRETGGLTFTRGGARAPLEADTLALRALVRGAIATSLGRGTEAGGTLAVTRVPPRRPLHVTVSPVGRETVTLWGDGQPAAVVILTDPERGPRPVPKELQRLLSLTPTQARLTALLVEGSTVAEAAEQLGILASTARNHLKEALSRAGVRRQSELVALALRSIPPLR
jgi:DNA-binding CsgD family transcriptional regulator/PAS domain-containing protein